MWMKQTLWQSQDIVLGWANLIPSPVATQAIAAAGADWVMIDQEHGPVGWESLHAMIAATAGTRCSPWVRVPAAEPAHVKPALDAGAEGIKFPLVTSAADAANCVALTRYPPLGRRGWGPFVAHARWGAELRSYGVQQGLQIVCILLIETRAAIESIEEICRVDGVDGLFIAPFDLSTDLGVSGDLDSPELKRAISHAERAILSAGIPLGGVAFNREHTAELVGRGYRIIGQGFDVLALAQSVRQAAQWRTA
ncbi:MAG: hypothetical protein JOY71_00335 [Acetobacteraceae bacterium]|nr:hypothetical protein [Acetobacteraceae bacterium]MBV8520580.1 hypothetical protein [Acetobacteraceae bacterium]